MVELGAGVGEIRFEIQGGPEEDLGGSRVIAVKSDDTAVVGDTGVGGGYSRGRRKIFVSRRQIGVVVCGKNDISTGTGFVVIGMAGTGLDSPARG